MLTIRAEYAAGLQTSLPFPHKIVAGSPESDPFLLISGPSITSKEDSIDVQMKEAGGIYIGVQDGSTNTFRQPLEVFLRSNLIHAILAEPDQ